jgi:integrase
LIGRLQIADARWAARYSTLPTESGQGNVARPGIARLHVHAPGYTFGCRWLERGGSLAALQEPMGHASIHTTQRYAWLAEDLVVREAARARGRTVWQKAWQLGSDAVAKNVLAC